MKVMRWQPSVVHAHTCACQCFTLNPSGSPCMQMTTYQPTRARSQPHAHAHTRHDLRTLPRIHTGRMQSKKEHTSCHTHTRTHYCQEKDMYVCASLATRSCASLTMASVTVSRFFLAASSARICCVHMTTVKHHPCRHTGIQVYISEKAMRHVREQEKRDTYCIRMTNDN